MNTLNNKHIVLGVTGGIAAYKSADLVRRLKEQGAMVRVVMTANAKQFITPLTMQAVSGHPIHDDLFDWQAEAAMGHIELARWADLILIAPATADFIAKLTHGEADDLLATLCLASKAPIALAPAMNQVMWQQAITQQNLLALKNKNIHIFGPGSGSQACGEVGPGRMFEPIEIVQLVNDLFKTGSLSGVSVLLTAGPTLEPIDPVRFISNHSSGKMGYALADAAREAGAQVTLISGPTALKPPDYVTVIPVQTTQDMYETVLAQVGNCDMFIGVAAVCDYQVEKVSSQKLKKQTERLTLTFVPTVDIIAAVGQLRKKPYLVGFAAETENVLTHAREKLKKKNIDMIIANEVGANLNMGTDDNCVTVLTNKEEIAFPRLLKDQLARQLMALIANAYRSSR